jgi:hypothetical protein
VYGRRVTLRSIDSVRAVTKFDSGVCGRTAVIGAISGALMGAVAVPAMVVLGSLQTGRVEWAEFAEGVLFGLVYLALIGALVGVAAGTVAGLLLFAAGPVVSRSPRPVQRVVAAVGCAAPFGLPILIAGLGFDLWLGSGWDDLSYLIMVIAVLLGLWKGPYIFTGRVTAGPDAVVNSGSVVE